VPVVPLALRGLWGSFFSRKDGPAMSRPLRRGLFSRIELVAGDAGAADAATPGALQAIVAGLRGERRNDHATMTAPSRPACPECGPAAARCMRAPC
jgi:hypothetical protein